MKASDMPGYKETLETFYDTKEKKLRDLRTIGIQYAINTSPGYAMPGYQITTPNGKNFVVVDQDTRRQAMGYEIAKGMRPLFENGERYGDIMLAGEDTRGNSVYARPELVYEAYTDANGDQRFGEHLNLHRSDGRVERGSVESLTSYYAPLFNSSLGYGASKSDNTAFQYFMFNQLNDELSSN